MLRFDRSPTRLTNGDRQVVECGAFHVETNGTERGSFRAIRFFASYATRRPCDGDFGGGFRCVERSCHRFAIFLGLLGVAVQAGRGFVSCHMTSFPVVKACCLEYCHTQSPDAVIFVRAETNTSSTRLPGSSKYPNYPIAGIRIR